MIAQDNSILLIINYHYIRDPDQYPYPGIHPITMEEFTEQVNWLRDRFYMATPGEVEAFATMNVRLPGPSIFLTFDDGLSEHEIIAREILRPLGIRGAFFIASRPFLDHRALMVHKIHWLRANMHPDEFYHQFTGLLPQKFKDVKMDEESIEAALRTYIYDTRQDAMLKYLINFQLPSEIVDQVASEMLNLRRISENDFCNQLYMSESQIRALAEDGHIIGSHGHTHRVFSNLERTVLEEELRTNISYIEKIAGSRPRWISYPYGTIQSVPDNIDAVCEKFGFSIGLLLDKDRKRWNTGDESSYQMDRINSNHLKELCI
ncbi:MAG: polysaccharide deacetylase family protein [Deltaproteobacteria bacterium]|nr:polysaccharide deacetylase family protein [Deltaproteobacteria bacterium]